MSEVYNWSVYLLSSALLLGLVAPVLNLSISASGESETTSIVTGIVRQLDSLSPGLKTTLHFTTGVVPGGSVELHGHDVVGSFASFYFVRRCKVSLPSIRLSPGETYEISIRGGNLTIEKAGLG
jgi:hypothetical protein